MCSRYEWDDLGYSHNSHYQDCATEVQCYNFAASFGFFSPPSNSKSQTAIAFRRAAPRPLPRIMRLLDHVRLRHALPRVSWAAAACFFIAHTRSSRYFPPRLNFESAVKVLPRFFPRCCSSCVLAHVCDACLTAANASGWRPHRALRQRSHLRHGHAVLVQSHALAIQCFQPHTPHQPQPCTYLSHTRCARCL